MDQAATFAMALPKWTGPDGLPLSWRHFVYGMAHIGRNDVRRMMDDAAAVRAGMTTQEDYAGWREKMEPRA